MKNKSKIIKDGTIVYTRDENLFGGKPKPNMPEGLMGRPTIIVASNKANELALVKITSTKKYPLLKDMTAERQRKIKNKNKTSHVNTHLRTRDNLGNPIIIGDKFHLRIRNKKVSKVSRSDLEVIQKSVFRNSKQQSYNRSKARNMKGRKGKRK